MMTATVMDTWHFQISISGLWQVLMQKGKYTWKHFLTIRTNQFLILVNIYYYYKVFKIYSFWFKTVFNNYGSDFDVLISIIRILMTNIKKIQRVTFLEIITTLAHFCSPKMTKKARISHLKKNLGAKF